MEKVIEVFFNEHGLTSKWASHLEDLTQGGYSPARFIISDNGRTIANIHLMD